jgi:hypothetical protein
MSTRPAVAIAARPAVVSVLAVALAAAVDRAVGHRTRIARRRAFVWREQHLAAEPDLA